MTEFTGPARRCVCLLPKPYRLDQHFVACSTCEGWFAIEVGSAEELDALHRRFASTAAAD